MGSFPTIHRAAIGSSGRVGSLYDGYRNCTLEQVKVVTEEISSEPVNTRNCDIIKGGEERSRDLLQMIGIEDELRLSVLLNPSSRTSLAALIDHPDPFDEYTRFLRYTYTDRYERLNQSVETPDLSKLPNADVIPTHIITNVDWGIDVVIVLQLPSKTETVPIMDEILQKIHAILFEDPSNTKISVDDKKLFEDNVKTKIYSKIPDLRRMTSVFTVCQFIKGSNDQLNNYHPIKYQLRSIKSLCPEYTEPEVDFSFYRSPSIGKLEQHLIHLLARMKNLMYSFDGIRNGFLRTHLKERLQEMQQERIDLHKSYEKEMNRIQDLIVRIRRSNTDFSEIDQIVETFAQTTLSQWIESFHGKIQELETKEKFIHDLDEQHFEYCDATTLRVSKENYMQILLKKFVTNQKESQILCSNGTLNQKDQAQFNTLRDQLIGERDMNASLRLVYVDFSYCSFPLPSILTLPPTASKNMETQDKFVNILLLGESGVGKSTFINALINYLAFETLGEAESKEPIALIPVSFLMTSGNNFDETKINFGPADNFNNEDFNHPGESVTQHCKSYVFALKQIDGKKLRIIDTPGFGDTRGLDQDDVNMQHILKYINNLTHLNAICFLLKPNESQINKYFSICLTQLLDLLGPDARHNIVFCFTNARPTFYTPGDTASPLKAMLHSSSKDDIPFKKENTFCFDSESFRYLIALKKGINFNDLDRKEYEISWSNSLKESNRLVHHVVNELPIYSSYKQRQSIKNAQIQITQMIRPMLETIRNLFRHVVMNDKKILDKSIQLKPIAVYRPASKCASCNLIYDQFGDFLIAQDDLHEMLHRCHLCECAPNEHNSIDYKLQYELLNTSSKYERKQMDKSIRQLLSASSEFAYFLMGATRSKKDDPFLMGLTNIVIEEYKLSEIKKPTMLNSKLLEHLRSLQDEHENDTNEMNSNKKSSDLPTVYKKIEEIRALPEVRVQLAAVAKGQQMLMKEYEYVVPDKLTIHDFNICE